MRPLSDKTYELAKFVAQILLPALGTLYFSLAGIWGLPAADEVVGTIMAVDLFIGVILGLSSGAYAKSGAKYDGTVDVISLPGNKLQYLLNLDDDPETLKDKNEITFRVNAPK